MKGKNSSPQKWGDLASDDSIAKAKELLIANGFGVEVVENGQEAKEKVLSILPKGAEVMTMTSMTLEAIGVLPAINESVNYDSVRAKLNSMDRATQGREMQKMGAAPEWTVGSVHSVTEDGKVMVASNTGSQLPAYAYGADHVIWVVGTQKIVANIEEAQARLYEYTLPLEDERVKEAYGMPNSFVSKQLIFNREVNPDRITIIFVKEKLGF